MNKKEKNLIEKAIDLIHGTDGGYDEGMTILCHLIGRQTIADRLGDTKQIDLREFIKLVVNDEKRKKN